MHKLSREELKTIRETVGNYDGLALSGGYARMLLDHIDAVEEENAELRKELAEQTERGDIWREQAQAHREEIENIPTMASLRGVLSVDRRWGTED